MKTLTENQRKTLFLIMLLLMAAFVITINILLDQITNPLCCITGTYQNKEINECGNCTQIKEKYSNILLTPRKTNIYNLTINNDIRFNNT
jgi:hypothetical protein